ncbi:MAG: hypothetical protein E6R08_04075 [Nevskiaceae bacterium]|nr:MAG: hypothetical protein E6R08_04075 [Nevskiaceae bacterium]
MNAKLTCIEKARAAWGEELPDWVEALARACDAASQAQVATRIGKSKSTVSLVIAKQYNAGLSAIEQTVRGVLMLATVACPVVGDIALDQCHRNQRASGNGLERSLFGPKCPTCQHRRGN